MNKSTPKQKEKLARAVRMVKAGYPVLTASKIHHVSERYIRREIQK